MAMSAAPMAGRLQPRRHRPGGALGTLGEARIGYAHGQYLANQTIGQAGTAKVEFKEVGFTGSLVLDQLDNAASPAVAGARWRSVRLAQEPGRLRRLFTLAGQGHGRHHHRAQHLEAGLELGGFLDVQKVGFSDWRLGRFQRLSGYRNEQISGNFLALGKVVYRYRLSELTPFGRAIYIGRSLETGNASANRDDIAWSSLRRAGSLFLAADTPLGLAYLGLGAPGGHSAIYLFLGRP